MRIPKPFFKALLLGVVLFSFRLPFVYAEKLYYIAPTELSSVTREMKTAGFWASRHPFPDKVILDAEGIEALNAETQGRKLIKDITKLAVMYPGDELKALLRVTLNDLSKKKFYLADGSRAGEYFFERAHNNLNLNAIPAEIRPEFGFIVRFSDQRFLPVEDVLMVTDGDIDFDELQNSDLDIGTPVRVFHTSLDGKWAFVESDISSGWVKKENISPCPQPDIEKFLSSFSFIVVTAPKADIFLNATLTAHYDHVRMGARFTLLKKWEDDGLFEILLPLIDEERGTVFTKAYIKKEDANEWYLKYTPRNVLTQAFKLLNSPYGWGGMHGEQDCSRFLVEVFSTFGIKLPRDSKDQAKAGGLIAEFKDETIRKEKLFVLKNETVPAISLLCLKGHIMLFLDVVDGKPYAIHAVWGYRQKIDGKDAVRVINRVAISDLLLGEGSVKGSLITRLRSVVLVSR